MLNAFFQDRLPSWFQWYIRRNPHRRYQQRAAYRYAPCPRLSSFSIGLTVLRKVAENFSCLHRFGEKGCSLGATTSLRGWKRLTGTGKKGNPMSVALIGPQGCGKTSQTNCYLKRLPQNARIIQSELQKRFSSKPACLSVFLPGSVPVAGVKDLMQEAALCSPYVYRKKTAMVLVDDLFDYGFLSVSKVKAYVIDVRLVASDITERIKESILEHNILPKEVFLSCGGMTES